MPEIHVGHDTNRFFLLHFLQVASEEIKELPEFMHTCTMTYMPQVGYLLCIQSWDRDVTMDVETDFIQRLPDSEFVFSADGLPYLKTRRFGFCSIISS